MTRMDVFDAFMREAASLFAQGQLSRGGILKRFRARSNDEKDGRPKRDGNGPNSVNRDCILHTMSNSGNFAASQHRNHGVQDGHHKKDSLFLVMDAPIFDGFLPKLPRSIS